MYLVAINRSRCKSYSFYFYNHQPLVLLIGKSHDKPFRKFVVFFVISQVIDIWGGDTQTCPEHIYTVLNYPERACKSYFQLELFLHQARMFPIIFLSKNSSHIVDNVISLLQKKFKSKGESSTKFVMKPDCSNLFVENQPAN